MEKNATSLARRFRNLAGLKLLLADELAALEAAKRKAVSALDELSEACTHRPQTLVEQVRRISHACIKPIEQSQTALRTDGCAAVACGAPYIGIHNSDAAARAFHSI